MMTTEGGVNKTYEYGVNLYKRWCKENKVNEVDSTTKTVERFLVAHKEGWPTGSPKELRTVKMRLQAVKKFYKTSGSNLDFKEVADKLTLLS